MFEDPRALYAILLCAVGLFCGSACGFYLGGAMAYRKCAEECAKCRRDSIRIFGDLWKGEVRDELR